MLWEWLWGGFMVAASLIGVLGFLGMCLGFFAPYGWFAGEDVDRRSRARRLFGDVVRQVAVTIVVVEVWLQVRGR